MSRSDLPLVTLCVPAYRQAGVVRHAIENAFAQTYPNLEIILSDDCSPDATFRVMDDLAAAYRGLHLIELQAIATISAVWGAVAYLPSNA